MSMYPENKKMEIAGKEILFPGVDENGKFTNGDFSDTEKPASFIPAEWANLITDNLSFLIEKASMISNNNDSNQVFDSIVKIATDIVDKAMIEKIFPVGRFIITTKDEDPSSMYPETIWQLKDGVVLKGRGGDYNSVAQTVGNDKHVLNINEMPNHNHKQTNVCTYTASSPNLSTIQTGGWGGITTFNAWTEAQGAGHAHNNVQRSYIVNIWERIA